jgi:Rrf2 family protein
MMESLSACVGGTRKHLYTLLTALKHAGLVRAVRGARGGYELARRPEQISVHEVVHCLEEDESQIDCRAGGRSCGQLDACATREVWLELDRAVEQVLSAVHLSDLAARQLHKSAEPPMFHI